MPIWMLANWRLAAKGIVAAAVLVTLVCAFLTIRGWKQDALRLPVVQAELQAVQNQIAAERAEYERLRGISNDYQAELARLRTAKPAPVVRLCRDTPRPVVRPSGPASGPDAAPAPGGVVPAEPGRDIGPELAALMDRGDQLSAQLRGLIAACTGAGGS